MRSTYQLEVPERYNAVLDEVETWAAEEPDALALVIVEAGADPSWLSIGDLAHHARQAAAMLVEHRIGRGDVVLLALPRVTEWYAVLLGAIRIGAVPVTLPACLPPEALVTLARRIRPTVVVGDGRAAAVIDRHSGSLPTLRRRFAWRADHHGLLRGWEDVSTALDRHDSGEPLDDDPTAASDPMAMVLSRGTAGRQRLVVQPQSWVLGDIDAARFWLDLRPGDMHWTMPEPDAWTPPWTGMFAPWHERASILQSAEPLDARAALDVIAVHGVTSLCGSTGRYGALIEHPAAASSLRTLRHCTTTGGPLSPAVSRGWRRLSGLRLYEAYGQAESTIVVANFRSLAARPGSMGKPMPGWDVAVHDDAGHEVKPGIVGRLMIRGQGWERRNTAAWHDTGDLARVDEDGYLWFIVRGEAPQQALDMVFSASRWS